MFFVDLPKSPPISLVSTSDTEITVKWNQVVNRDDPLTGTTNSGNDFSFLSWLV